ncbi:hypothetical protein AYO44_07585 [Planctomycetaceae bacterium SCGC AG-212-F19]|nr:hypothetical protein AYO44_07585 [Planctomycetaceae bacterium SCGC AG-212-F19]
MVASAASSLFHVQSDFLTALPRITRHARCYFRHVPCRHRKADFVSEVLALSWKWWLRLIERGKNPRAFVSVLASFAAKAVRSGRRVCGQLPAKDAMSERAQQRHAFSVSKLPDFATESTNPLQEALTDNTQSPVPDQVQFRCDFPNWLTAHTQRDRKIAVEMAKGEKTLALAQRFKLSPARVSQLRREFQDDWQRFTGDQLIPVAS